MRVANTKNIATWLVILHDTSMYVVCCLPRIEYVIGILGWYVWVCKKMIEIYFSVNCFYDMFFFVA